MKIENHRLIGDDGKPVRFVKTPNVGQSTLKPRFLVMHFTAGSSAKESIGWLANAEAKASAHLVIGMDGSITQMVPFNQVAWHAGKSLWKGINGLNSSSIGIELDNPGRLAKKGNDWVAYFGRKYPEKDVLVATHKNEHNSPAGWLRYPQAQLDAALAIAQLLVKTYGIQEIIGHDDISPGRKVDPGPAFPMDDFRAKALGQKPAARSAPQPAAPAASAAPQPAARSAPVAAPPRPPVVEPTGTVGETFVVTAPLRIRKGPSTVNPPVPGSPLPPGTPVRVLEERGGWKHVEVLRRVNGVENANGWVAARYLERDRVPALKISGAKEGAGV